MTRTITAVYKKFTIYLTLYAEGGITASAQLVSRAWDDIDLDFYESEPFESDELAFEHVAESISLAPVPDYEFEFNQLDWTEI